MGKLLKREDILNASDSKYEVVSVPEWGGDVKVKSMTGLERDSFEQSCLSKDGKGVKMDNIRAKLVAKTVVDEDDKPLFTEADVGALSQKSGAALDRVFAVAQRLSGMRKEDIDELTKN